MIIPIRCFTCGKVLADKWEYYTEKCKEINETNNKTNENNKDNNEVEFKNIEGNWKLKIFQELDITKMCCKRHMLSHVDLIELL